jgi:hypothetical protein
MLPGSTAVSVLHNGKRQHHVGQCWYFIPLVPLAAAARAFQAMQVMQQCSVRTSPLMHEVLQAAPEAAASRASSSSSGSGRSGSSKLLELYCQQQGLDSSQMSQVVAVHAAVETGAGPKVRPGTNALGTIRFLICSTHTD